MNYGYGKVPIRCNKCGGIQHTSSGWVDDKCQCGGELDFYPYKSNKEGVCKWCGGSGRMNTWGNDGRLLSGAPCICPLGKDDE